MIARAGSELARTGRRMAVAIPSWSALLHGARLAYTTILTVGIGVHVVDAFMVAALMPSVVAEIRGAAFYTWAAMLYTVHATLGIACGGYLATTYGVRYAAVAGVLVLGLGNAAAAMAPTMPLFLVARALHGLGGGVVVAQAYGIVSAFYPAALRPRVLTTISMAHGSAALIGPIVGGTFAAIGWWRGALWTQLPILIVLGGLIWWWLPRHDGTVETGPLPLGRLVLLASAVLTVAVSGQLRSAPLRFIAVGAAVMLVKLTFALDARAAARLFPLRPLSAAHPVGMGLCIVSLFNLTTAHMGIFMPLVVQQLHGVSPLFAGYFQALLSLAWTSCAIVSAGLQEDAVRRVIVVGPLFIMGGVIGQALLAVNGSLSLLSVAVAMTGAGMGLCFAHISSWTMASARPNEANLTASAIPTMQSLGRGFGAATAGLVANAAGLGAGLSRETVAWAATWVYGVAVVAPAVIVMLAFTLLNFHRASREQFDPMK
jgi:MFS family permease